MKETDEEVMKKLWKEINAPRDGRLPIALFDLDGTLFDNGPRTWRILVEYAQESRNVELEQDLLRSPSAALPYTVAEILRGRAGVNEKVEKAAFAFWRERFFTHDAQAADVVIPGALAFVKSLYQAGVWIWYLTGRDAPNMGQGCAAALTRAGFPLHVQRTTLTLKPKFEMSDRVFKTGIVKWLQSAGSCVATFENEPANANLFRESWPNGFHFLLDTSHAPGAPELDPNVIRIPNFLSLTPTL